MAEGAAARLVRRLSPGGWFTVGLLGLAVFGWLHSVPTFPDPDAYYHGAMAEQAWQGELPTSLPQAWFTELRLQFHDQHLLYHYLLAPFVAAFGAAVGLKVASVLLAAAALVALYVAAGALGSGSPWVAPAIALASPAWLYRLGLVKVTPLALVVLLAGLVLAARRRPLAVAMVAMLFSYVYIGFALLPLVVTAFLFVDWLVDRDGRAGSRLGTAAAAWVGAAVGFVANPYFPGNVQQFISQFWAIGVANSGGIGVAAEWSSADAGWLVRYAAVPVLALAAAAAAAYLNPRRRFAAALAAVSFCALAAAVRSRRYIEYAVPLIALAAAVGIPLGAAAERAARWWRTATGKPSLLLAAALAAAGVTFGVSVTRAGLGKLFPASGLGGACTWLRQNVPPGEVVYNVNWGEWPLLYSCRRDLRYIAGLDMRFMHRAYPQLAERYQRIARGELAGPELTRTIRSDFGASFVVVTENNADARDAIAAAPGVFEAYADSRVAVYRINER